MIKFSVYAAYKGHLYKVEGDTADELRKWLETEGKAFNPFFSELKNSTPVAVVGGVMTALDLQSVTQKGPGGIPLCPTHHTEMRKSANGKGFYCSKRTDSGFCLYRANDKGEIHVAKK